MCFYNDYEWCASINEETEPVADKPFHCDECGVRIAVGEQYYHLFQQEREECRRCEDGECDCTERDADVDHECQCETPDLGESWDYSACLECRKFLKGVAAHEKAEGCDWDESLPALGEMIDQIRQFDRPQVKAYFDEAENLYPELRTSGYLDRLWERMGYEVEA